MIDASVTPASTRPAHDGDLDDSDEQLTKSTETQKSFPLTRLAHELVSKVFEAVIQTVKGGEGMDFDAGEPLAVPLKARQSLTLSSISRDLRQIALSTPSLWVYLSETMRPEGIDTFAARSGTCLLHVLISSSASGSSAPIHRLCEHSARWGFVHITGRFMESLAQDRVTPSGRDPLLSVQTLNIAGGRSELSLISIFHTVPSLRELRIKGSDRWLSQPVDARPARIADGSPTSLGADVIPPALRKIALLGVNMTFSDVETLLSALRQSAAWSNLAESKIDIHNTVSPPHPAALDALVDEWRGKIEITFKSLTIDEILNVLNSDVYRGTFGLDMESVVLCL